MESYRSNGSLALALATSYSVHGERRPAFLDLTTIFIKVGTFSLWVLWKIKKKLLDISPEVITRRPETDNEEEVGEPACQLQPKEEDEKSHIQKKNTSGSRSCSRLLVFREVELMNAEDRPRIRDRFAKRNYPYHIRIPTRVRGSYLAISIWNPLSSHCFGSCEEKTG